VFFQFQNLVLLNDRQGRENQIKLAHSWLMFLQKVSWRQEKEESLEKGPDRLFLFSLLEDFIKVPIKKKAALKIAIIKAIDDGTIQHSYRPPYEPINYPPPTPVLKTSFHYGTDVYNGPSTSASQTCSCNVHHTP
jgi:hypothetical protein